MDKGPEREDGGPATPLAAHPHNLGRALARSPLSQAAPGWGGRMHDLCPPVGDRRGGGKPTADSLWVSSSSAFTLR